jgi:hypothetical protein
VDEDLHDPHRGETLRVRAAEHVVAGGVRRCRAHRGDEQPAARVDHVQQPGRARVGVGERHDLRAAIAAGGQRERRHAVGRGAGQLRGVEHEVVGDVLARLPAGPGELARGLVPPGRRRGERVDRVPDGQGDVISGDRHDRDRIKTG